MRRVIIFIIFFILVIAIFGYYQAESGLTLVGRYFPPSDQLSKADAIVVAISLPEVSGGLSDNSQKLLCLLHC